MLKHCFILHVTTVSLQNK